MATVRPHPGSDFYRLFGRWNYARLRRLEPTVGLPPIFYRIFGRWNYARRLRRSDPTVGLPPISRDEDGWLVNVPQDFIDYLKACGCPFDERPG
jgi:hypothetical protein